MPNVIQIKRRASGNAGAPAALKSAELAQNEVDNTLYMGKCDDGAGISGTPNTPDYTSYTLGGSPGDGFLSTNCIIRKLVFHPVKTNSDITTRTV